MGLKLKYQFDEELMEPYISSKQKNNEDDELPAKKFKLNDNKKISILEYSSVQLPVAPFIDYLEKYSKSFVDQCLTHNQSNKKNRLVYLPMISEQRMQRRTLNEILPLSQIIYVIGKNNLKCIFFMPYCQRINFFS